MKKLLPYIIVLFVSLLLVIAIVIADNNVKTDPEEQFFSETFQTDSRPFMLGLAGYTPAGIPNPQTSDVLNFWNDVDGYSEIYGVHIDWKDTTVFDVSLASQSNPIAIVLGFQDPDEWSNNVDDFIATAKFILNKSEGRITHFGIGNEVNLLNEKYRADFPKFIGAYKFIYSKLKEDYPDVKFYTTFQYETLLGEGFLTGMKDERKSQVELVDQFIESLDAIALTFYPYFDYPDPNAIPDDYLTKFTSKYDKPLVITETGWIARETFPEGFDLLVEQGYIGSELEQVDFLKKLNEILPPNTEFVSWAFLNDYQDYMDATDQEENLIFNTIGLRENDATPKEVFELWKELIRVSYSE